MIPANDLTNHWLALGWHYSIQQQRVYPIVWVVTLPNNDWGNFSLCFFLWKHWREIHRSPKIPSMRFARRGRMRQPTIIAGGTTSFRTYSLTIGYGPIWSVGPNGFVLSIGRRLTILHCCCCCIWGSSIGKLPTIIYTRPPKRSGMVPPSRFDSFPG